MMLQQLNPTELVFFVVVVILVAIVVRRAWR